MIRKSTFFLLIIFLLLVGLAYGFQQDWFNKPAVEPTPSVLPLLMEGYPLEDLISLEVTDNGLIILEISRQVDGTWAITKPEDFQADSGKIEQLLSSLYGLSPSSTVSASTPLEPLGISPDSLKITLINNSGELRLLKPGGITPTGSGYFFQIDSNPAIVISKYGYEGFVSMLQPESLQFATPAP